MASSVKVRRTMRRKDGNAKATLVKNTSVKITEKGIEVKKSKKIVPKNVRPS